MQNALNLYFAAKLHLQIYLPHKITPLFTRAEMRSPIRIRKVINLQSRSAHIISTNTIRFGNKSVLPSTMGMECPNRTEIRTRKEFTQEEHSLYFYFQLFRVHFLLQRNTQRDLHTIIHCLAGAKNFTVHASSAAAKLLRTPYGITMHDAGNCFGVDPILSETPTFALNSILPLVGVDVVVVTAVFVRCADCLDSSE